MKQNIQDADDRSHRSMRPVVAEQNGSNSSATLRVLHLTQSSAPGGLQRLLRELVPLQVERGLTVGVASPPTNGLDPIVTAAGGQAIEWRAIRGLRPSAVLREARQLREILAAFEPDVVHMHSSKAGLVGRLLVRGPSVFQPQAWSFHHVPTAIRPLLIAWEWVAQFLVSRTVCSSFEEQAEGAQYGLKRRSSVIQNGIDLSSFPLLTDERRSEARAALGISATAPVAVCLGRFCRQKGQDLLLDAWPAVRAQVPQAELIMIGNGPDEAVLRARGVDGVRWEPWQLDVIPYLAASNVVVMPSRWEGMSFGLIEALASGRSVVATAATAMRENIEPARSGAVVSFGPTVVADLARAISERLMDVAQADAEGLRGRGHAESLQVSTMEERLFATYQSIVRARKS